MLFIKASDVRKYLKSKGKRVNAGVLLALSGHVQNLLDKGARNTPLMTVKADDVFPGG